MSPVGHALSALIFARQPRCRHESKGGFFLPTALFVVFFSWLPDWDFVPGLLAGDAGLYHRGATHTPVFALVIGAIAFATMKAGGNRHSLFWALTAAAATASHLLLDYISAGPASGIMWLWPFSVDRFYPATRWFDGLTGPAGALFSSHNAAVLFYELCFAAVLGAGRGAARWIAAREEEPHGYLLRLDGLSAGVRTAALVALGMGGTGALALRPVATDAPESAMTPARVAGVVPVDGDPPAPEDEGIARAPAVAKANIPAPVPPGTVSVDAVLEGSDAPRL